MGACLSRLLDALAAKRLNRASLRSPSQPTTRTSRHQCGGVRGLETAGRWPLTGQPSGACACAELCFLGLVAKPCLFTVKNPIPDIWGGVRFWAAFGETALGIATHAAESFGRGVLGVGQKVPPASSRPMLGQRYTRPTNPERPFGLWAGCGLQTAPRPAPNHCGCSGGFGTVTWRGRGGGLSTSEPL